ncbi:MAG TPA: hypothetical protein VL307_03020, partial [Chitinophagaceae bacterium]|nr:hypothetical protein [Chitinophagaceae bacterium]
AEKVIEAINSRNYDLAVVSNEGCEPDFHMCTYLQKIIHNTNTPLMVLYSGQPRVSTREILQTLQSGSLPISA